MGSAVPSRVSLLISIHTQAESGKEIWSTVLTLVGAIVCKVSHSLSSCNAPRARRLNVSLLMTLVDGQHHQTVFFVACNSDSSTLAVLQETVLVFSSFAPVAQRYLVTL